MGAPGGPELVVLVDDRGRQIGTAPKSTVHTGSTPLHRAFSCYLFGPAGDLLLTRRSSTKQTFPGLWTNSVCGHPSPGESDLAAIDRRVGDEVDLRAEQVRVALPHFRYRAVSGGVVENEICPVYLGRTSGQVRCDPAEVEDHDWCSWPDFLGRLSAEPARFSPWCILQAAQLEESGVVRAYLCDPRPPGT